MKSLRLWVAAALFAGSTMAFGQETVPKTGIFILVDVSETWMNLTSRQENELILAEVNKTVMDLVSKVETPLAIYVIAIGTDSVVNRPVCEVVYFRQLVNFKNRPGEIASKDELTSHLELCKKAVLSRPIAKWTDIHGALAMVSQIAGGAAFNSKFLLVASDFKEERPAGDLPEITLADFRVASLYRVLPEDSRNPRGLQRRLNSWHAILKKAGASLTVDVVDKTRFAGNVTARLLARDKIWK